MVTLKFVYSGCITRFACSGAPKDIPSSGKSVNSAILGVALLIWVPLTGGSAFAQSGSYDPLSPSVTGATSGLQEFDTPPGFESRDNAIPRHRDIGGSPCLAVTGVAQPHAVDPNLYDDVITVENKCPQRIAMQVCYSQSDSCIQMDIPGESHEEAILGILPASKDFRFEFREKF
jgi:hypothetical protein